MSFSIFPSSKQLIILHYGDQTVRWLLQPGEKRPVLLDDRRLRRELPDYADLTLKGRRKAVDRYLKGIPVALRARIDESLPNVGHHILGRSPCRDDFQAGADAFLQLLDLFEDREAGAILTANLLCGFQMTTLRRLFPTFSPLIAIPEAGKSSEQILCLIQEAAAPKHRWRGKGDLDSLVPLLYGNITAGASTLGSAGIRVPGSAGETSEALEASRQIPSLIMADGPAGLRLRQCYQADRATGEVYGAGVLGSLENGFLEAPPRHESADTYYQFCTAFPVGTALAQSWDPDLLAQVGRAVSREMDEFHVDLWLAPGMNIQRNPLCGRNFEYYSEDPLLTGTLAAAITAGVQESGRHGVTLKHFACNNQEDNRMAVDARVSERALREIYLRGFEIAVKAAAPAAVMSAYNCINGVHAANSRDLCTVVLRQEWGFAGLVMSDWNTTVPQDGSTPWRCAWAGNDVIMPGNPHDDADIRAALADGRLPETAARQSAARLIALASALRGG